MIPEQIAIPCDIARLLEVAIGDRYRVRVSLEPNSVEVAESMCVQMEKARLGK